MAPAKKSIVVTGATGVMGGAVARHFSNNLGFHIRTISRNPGSAAAATLQEDIPGVEIARGDMDDESSLYSVFSNAHAIFLRTHFWMLLKDDQTKERAAKSNLSVNHVAMAREAEQWANMFNAIAQVLCDQEAAGVVTLEKIVISTLPDPSTISDGKYSHADHFESKAKGVSQLLAGVTASRPGFQLLSDRTSYLYVGVYLESFFSKSMVSPDGRQLIGPTKLSDGSFQFYQVAVEPFKAIPLLYAKRDLGPLVEALVVDAPAGTHLMGGQAMTLAGFASSWGKALGVPVTWQACGVEEMVAEFTKVSPDVEDFARTASQAAAFVTEFGFDGGMGAQWPCELGLQLGDLVEWIRDRDWSEWL